MPYFAQQIELTHVKILDMSIIVKNILNSDLALFHDEGLVIHEKLIDALDKKQPVEISFEGITKCSTQFLNSAIGKLYLSYDSSLIDHLLSYNYSNVNLLSEKIKEVRANAINSQEYNSFIQNATA